MDKVQRKWEARLSKIPPKGLDTPVTVRKDIKFVWGLSGLPEAVAVNVPDLSPSLGWHMLYEENKRLKADIKEMKAIIEEGVENWMERLSGRVRDE